MHRTAAASSGKQISLPSRAKAWLQLTRPPNVVTAWADVVAGYSVAVVTLPQPGQGVFSGDLALLILATTGLYAGGVVLNDVFDAPLDRRERPERPIPSGSVGRSEAAVFGGGLLVVGIVAAFFVSVPAGALASLVAVCALLYDSWGKHRRLFGPMNMGLCRGGNLLMAVAAVPAAVVGFWYLALLPLVYIAAITAISRGEVHGGSRIAGAVSLGFLVALAGGIAIISTSSAFSFSRALPFLLLFFGIVGPLFVRAARRRDPASIRAAVKMGVLSLILLDAALAGGFGGWGFALGAAALLPVSVLLARLFAVT